MNSRADNINGLVEHQMVVRFSPKLAQRVRTEFVDQKDESQRPPFEIEWVDERHANVTVGTHVFPGLLLDLPTINETYKMASKSRLFKSGDIGQMLIVHNPDDPEEVEFFENQRYDPTCWTLLSGISPPTTFCWSRIFRKQNKPPKVNFNKVEADLGDVNIIGKEDVEMEFIHPKELETLYLKPGQSLVVDGYDIPAVEGKSVAELIKIKRMEDEEKARRLAAELKKEKKEKKKEKKRRKSEPGLPGSEGANTAAGAASSAVSASEGPGEEKRIKTEESAADKSNNNDNSNK